MEYIKYNRALAERMDAQGRIELINYIVFIINECEKTYRDGNPVMSDAMFDDAVDDLRSIDPTNKVLHALRGETFLGEKVKLKHPMGSLTNIKTDADVKKWVDTIGENTFVVVMPKFDGISSTRSKFRRFVSRGDGGTEGTDITKYCKYFDKPKSEIEYDCRGEIVISRANFVLINEMRVAGGDEPYKSERSAVVGIMQSSSPQIEQLLLLDFIPYTMLAWEHEDKSNQLHILNENFAKSCPYEMIEARDVMSKDVMSKMFREWSIEYEIDGLVVEINDSHSRIIMGNETNSFNPRYGRAYKVGFEEEKDTVVTQIIQQIGKGGAYTPVIIIEPVILCGNTISRISGDNERFLLYYGVGVGSEVTLKKSGNVIPRLTKIGDTKILPFKEFNDIIDRTKISVEDFQSKYDLDSKYTTPSVVHSWDINRVNIIKPEGVISATQIIRRNHFFFANLGVLDVGESMITNMYEAGLTTIPEILSASDETLLKLPNFGKKKLDKFKEEILIKMGRASLEAIMHSSGLFDKVGETKLKLLNLSESNKTITYNEAIAVDGIGSVMSKTVSDNIVAFWEFWELIKHKIVVVAKPTGSLSGEIICFTGFRDKNLMEQILENGGEYKESMNKSVTLLVHEDSSTNTTKVLKATKDGIATIKVSDFKKKFNDIPQTTAKVNFGGLL